MRVLKHVIKMIILFLIGGGIYYSLELLFRGRSHWTMIVCGGACFIAIGSLNELFDFQMSLLKQMLYSAMQITAIEFIFGYILNCWLHLGIWDYSNMPGNVLGQICPQFTILWFFLSAIGIILDDFIRWKFFSEEVPHYRLFKDFYFDD